MKENDYDWTVTLWKALTVFIFGGIGALLQYLTGLPQTETIIIVIAILTALENYLKHK